MRTFDDYDDYRPLSRTSHVSKRLRFEIFKRDAFTCQYCGGKPPDVRLEVDHIHPRADGGANDELNLVTSCADCNRGKSDITLADIPAKPDAVEAYLRAQQEYREAQHYLETLQLLEETRAQIEAALLRHWSRTIGKAAPPPHILRGWMARHTPVEITEAIDILDAQFRYRPERFETWLDLHKYVSGILRKKREQENEPEQAAD